MTHLGDITKISGHTAPVVDCIIGGSPCQDVSIAGRRAGLAGERSGLLMHQLRIVREMREEYRKRGCTGSIIRPRFRVWENVPGAFSSNGGRDFQTVLSEIIRIAEPDAPNVPLPPKGKWPLADAYYGDGWSVAYRVLDAQFWGTAYYLDDGSPLRLGTPQRRRRIALVADFGGRAAPEILFERERVSGNIETGGQEREDAGSSAGSSADLAIALRMRAGCAGGGKGLREEVSPAFAVFRQYKFGEYREGVGTITSGTGTCHSGETLIVEAVDCRNGATNPDFNGTLQAKSTGGQSLNLNNAVLTTAEDGTVLLDGQPCTVIRLLVRRLTPPECERLQGYPDGWTDIGPWVDSKGKVHKESSDSARYKALGNSIALPQWKWVLKRIAAYYERDATMASLFDGIGGFPLLWEQLNGKGSCLWASEIEEFPVAVTRYHFGEGDST